LYVKVFRLDNPEADIVQTILDGLSPACRSYLVFADKPTSYADLDYLCVQAANAEYADKLRSALPESSIRPLSITRPAPSSNSSRPRPVIECFYCHRQGHMIQAIALFDLRVGEVITSVRMLAIMAILRTLSAHLVAPNDYCLRRLSRLFLIGLGAQVCTPCHHVLFPGFLYTFLILGFALCWIRVVLVPLFPFHCMIDCVS
jgi:hypothetical protein